MKDSKPKTETPKAENWLLLRDIVEGQYPTTTTQEGDALKA
jgi:hypothetical protein